VHRGYSSMAAAVNDCDSLAMASRELHWRVLGSLQHLSPDRVLDLTRKNACERRVGPFRVVGGQHLCGDAE
jgi:hypothetical protein